MHWRTPCYEGTSVGSWDKVRVRSGNKEGWDFLRGSSGHPALFITSNNLITWLLRCMPLCTTPTHCDKSKHRPTFIQDTKTHHTHNKGNSEQDWTPIQSPLDVIAYPCYGLQALCGNMFGSNLNFTPGGYWVTGHMCFSHLCHYATNSKTFQALSRFYFHKFKDPCWGWLIGVPEDQ